MRELLSDTNIQCNTNLNTEALILIGFFVLTFSSLVYHLMIPKLEIIGVILAILFYCYILPVLGFLTRVNLKKILNMIKTKKEPFSQRFPVTKEIPTYNNFLLKWINRYARDSYTGFAIMIVTGFALGFFLESLTFIFLSIFLLLCGTLSLICLLLFSFYSPDSSLNFSKKNILHDLRKFQGFNDRILQNLRVTIVYTLLIIVLLFLPRFPVLYLGGIIGADTWYTSALAMNVVETGKIGFIVNFLGIFELVLTEKAVVAPITLALGALFSGAPVLNFQFYLVIWMAWLGFLFFFHFLNVILPEFFPRASSKTVFRLSLLGSIMYYCIPTVASYTDGFFSGRTLFYIFFPLFLLVIWNWISKSTSKIKFIVEGSFLAVFLTSMHRLAGLIIVPLIIAVILFKLLNIVIKSINNRQLPLNSHQKTIIVSFSIFILLIVEPFIVLIRFLLYPSIPGWSGWYENNYFGYITQYLPFLEDVLELLSSIISEGQTVFLLSMVIGLGIVFPLFLIEIVLSPIIVPLVYKKNKFSLISLGFYISSKFALLPNLFLIYEGPYFYQASNHLFVIHIVITSYIFFKWIKSYDLLRRNRKLIQFNFNKVAKKVVLPLFLILLLQASFSEAFRVIRISQNEEPYSDYMTPEVIDLANFIDELPSLNNATIVTTGTRISMKLATLLPWIKFLPNHYAIYSAYDFFENQEYKLKNINISSLHELYTFMYAPFTVSNDVRQQLNNIKTLLSSSIGSNEANNLLKSFNIKMLIIPKTVSTKNMVSLLQSALEIYDPLYENTAFKLIDLRG